MKLGFIYWRRWTAFKLLEAIFGITKVRYLIVGDKNRLCILERRTTIIHKQTQEIALPIGGRLIILTKRDITNTEKLLNR